MAHQKDQRWGRRVWVKVTSQEVANAGVMPNGMTGPKPKNEELLGFSEETVARVLSEIRDE